MSCEYCNWTLNVFLQAAGVCCFAVNRLLSLGCRELRPFVWLCAHRRCYSARACYARSCIVKQLRGAVAWGAQVPFVAPGTTVPGMKFGHTHPPDAFVQENMITTNCFVFRAPHQGKARFT